MIHLIATSQRGAGKQFNDVLAATQRVAIQVRRPARGLMGALLGLVRLRRSHMRALIGALLCVCVVSSIGCQTERTSTSDGWRMPPEPRSAPQPPSDLRADRMLFTVGSKPDDTNNNGFPDSLRVSVALFSSQHPTALRQEGSFTFTMHRQGQAGAADGEPMMEWKVEGDAVKRAETQMLAGPSYAFQLSLLERGTDRLPLEQADLVCVFNPADGGPPVRCEGVRTIQIGRRGASGGG